MHCFSMFIVVMYSVLLSVSVHLRISCVLFVCVCIIAEGVPDEEQAPSDRQQEDSDIVELILQLEDEQRQRQHDRGFYQLMLT